MDGIRWFVGGIACGIFTGIVTSLMTKRAPVERGAPPTFNQFVERLYRATPLGDFDGELSWGEAGE